MSLFQKRCFWYFDLLLVLVIVAAQVEQGADAFAFSSPQKRSTTKVYNIDNKKETENKLAHRLPLLPFGPWLMAAVAAAIFGCSDPAMAADAGGDTTTINNNSLLRGNELFTANCAGCHAGGQNFVSEKKTLQQDALTKYLGGLEPATIQSFVMNSGQHKKLVFFKMPGGKLTEQEYQDVTTFVSDQAINEKW